MEKNTRHFGHRYIHCPCSLCRGNKKQKKKYMLFRRYSVSRLDETHECRHTLKVYFSSASFYFMLLAWYWGHKFWLENSSCLSALALVDRQKMDEEKWWSENKRQISTSKTLESLRLLSNGLLSYRLVDMSTAGTRTRGDPVCICDGVYASLRFFIQILRPP
jgi:hypothetical protein